MQLDDAIGSPVQTATEWGVGRLTSAVSTASNWIERGGDAWVGHARAAGADTDAARTGYNGALRITSTAAQVVPIGRAAGVLATGLRAGDTLLSVAPAVARTALGSDNVGDLALDRVNDAVLPYTQAAAARLAPGARDVIDR